MKYLILLFFLILPVSGANVSIDRVTFDPVYKGLNYVTVQGSNKTDEPQIMAVHIYTRSPQLGKNGVGWGRPCFRELKPKESAFFRIPFKIQGPVTSDTLIRTSFGNPATREDFHSDNSFQVKTYHCGQLSVRSQAYVGKEADKNSAAEITSFFETFQTLLSNGEYEACWDSFSPIYQETDFHAKYLDFQKAMNGQPPFAFFCWEKDSFLSLKPLTVMKSEAGFHLTAGIGDDLWRIDFIKNENQEFQILWIDSPLMPLVESQNWEQTLLPKLETVRRGPLEIYYFPESTASKEIDRISLQRQKAIREITAFAGIHYEDTIRLVFFESEKIKLLKTAHQGNGWAYDNTIVEVYNKEVKLDPYHEVAHIVMAEVGNPPAILNEGFAVYISEQLGSRALRYLDGGEQTIQERTKGLNREGMLIPLEELMGYTEIGSEESKPWIAYPQAACFVKYLIEEYGRDSFLKAYSTMKNSNQKKQVALNIKIFESIYGQSIESLKSDWHQYINTD